MLVSESVLAVFRATLAYHLIVLSMVVIGLTFRDELAQRIRRASAVTLAFSTLVAVTTGLQHSVNAGPLAVYVSAMTGIAFCCWTITRERHFLIAALVNLSIGLCGVAGFGWQLLQQIRIPSGVRPLIWAVLCFSAGVLISALKGGLAVRLWPRQMIAEADAPEPLSSDELE